MAQERCQPFDLNRQGLILSEGAGVLVAGSRGARRPAQRDRSRGGRQPRHDIATRITSRARTRSGRAGSIGAMRQTIERSGITPDGSTSSTRTARARKHNDSAESKVAKDVFGDRRCPSPA